MATSPTVSVRKLPWWAPLAGSAVIVFHLFALTMFALGARSGPWPAPYGQDYSPGPAFAEMTSNAIYPAYLQPLGLTHNYHFATDQAAIYGVQFEVVLRDEQGVEINRLVFPQSNANYWVRHRQHLLAQGLAQDMPTEQRTTEKVALKGADVPHEDYWLNRQEVDALVHPKDPNGKLLTNDKGEPMPPLISPRYLTMFPGAGIGSLDSKTLAPNASVAKSEQFVRVSLDGDKAGSIPRNRPQMLRPAQWTVILAKTYLRHLCQEHGAYSAELIRHSRPAVLPISMYYQELPPLLEGTFIETIAHYGDLKQDFEEVRK
jgi:hypothetical protein